MKDETQNIKQVNHSISYRVILKTLYKYKKLYYKALSITFVFGCVYTLSLPNYYTCEVMLAPELGTINKSSLSSLASSLGLGMASMAIGSDAVSPLLYPDLMNSVDFKTSLFPIKIQCDTKGDDKPIQMTYYDYLLKEQKSPWWSEGIRFVTEGIGDILGAKKNEVSKPVNPFRLTKKQDQLIKSLNRKIVCDVDKKTLVITIDVTDQDPLVCATMADSVKTRLQDFITDYRTKKARVDYDYYQKLYEEAKYRYHAARHQYAVFADANQEAYLETVRQKMSELENEMQLQFNIYQQVVAQRQAAEAKVQQETPAFTTLQSATVPVKKSGPGRSKIVLMLLFLAFIAITARVLHKEGKLLPLMGL